MSVIACDMTALSADQRKRHQEVLKEIHKLRLETQEISDGYTFY
jgi:hypothetical protein